MRRVLPLLVLIIAGMLWLSGCSRSVTTPAGAPEGGKSALNGAPSETRSSDQALQLDAGPAGGRHETAPAVDLAIGKAAATAKSEQTTPQPMPAGQADDELLKLFEGSDLADDYQDLRRHLDQDPQNVEGRANLIYLLAVLASRREQEAPGEGHAIFQHAAQQAKLLLDSNPELPEGFDRILPVVFYHACRASAVRNDTKQAMEWLSLSVKSGFRNFDLLAEDENLAAVRALPEFADQLQQWKDQAAQEQRAHITESLTQFKSFPFDFQVMDVEGQPRALSDLKGKVVIVDIWGTWCPPCREEIPSFIKLQEKYGEQGLQIIGLNYEGEEGEKAIAKVKQFIQDFGINYPCALGTEEIQNQVPDFEGYPTTLFIDRTGKVRLKVVGLHDYAFLESVVTALLEEPAP